MEQHTVGLELNGSSTWVMTVDGKVQKAGDYPPIPVKGVATITFTIKNGANQAIKFADNPILLPPKEKVFTGFNGTDTQFVLTDHNPKQENIPYILQFKNAPMIDPIIDNNGGGSISKSYAADVAAAAVALVAGVVIGLVLQKRFRAI